MIDRILGNLSSRHSRAPWCRSNLSSSFPSQKSGQITKRQPRNFQFCRLVGVRTSGVGRWRGRNSVAYLDFLSLTLTWSHIISDYTKKRKSLSLVIFLPFVENLIQFACICCVVFCIFHGIRLRTAGDWKERPGPQITWRFLLECGFVDKKAHDSK